MRRTFVVLGLSFAVAAGAASFVILPSDTTQAAGEPTFIVPANDGYGIGECVSSGSSCAKVVADSWCEAQGFARSNTVGIADPVEVTGSTGAPVGRPISITCAQ